MIAGGAPFSRNSHLRAALLLHLFPVVLLSLFLAPPALAQYPTYFVSLDDTAIPAGSFGLNSGGLIYYPPSSSTAPFNLCFYTGFGSTTPIVPTNYVYSSYYSTFNYAVPASTIQDVPTTSFAQGAFSAIVYTIPTDFTSCTGAEQALGNTSTVTLNYPVLQSVSLPSLPEQNAALTSRLPSSLAVTGVNFIAKSGSKGIVPSAVNFTSASTPSGTSRFVSSSLLLSTIPTTISATASSVDIQVCNTATYSYCSNAITLNTAALQPNPGTLTATPNPALPSQSVTLTATFGPATATTAGAPSGPVTFSDAGSTLGPAQLRLDNTATFAQAPAQQFFTYALPIAPIVADFNLDGIPDTLLIDPGTGNSGASLNLFLGTVPNGSFAANQSFRVLSGDADSSFVIYSAAVADFNGDGIPDIVLLAATNFSGQLEKPTLYTLLGNGDGTFQNGFVSSKTLYGSQIVAGDFNKDGKQDIVIAGALNSDLVGLQSFFGDGTGNFIAGPATARISTAPDLNFGDFEVVAADFNKDGYPDVAVMNGESSAGELDNSIEIYQNTGKGDFDDPVRVTTDGTNTNTFFVAPLATGQLPSLIISSTNGQTIWSAPNQSTSAKVSFGSLVVNHISALSQTMVGDFDGDGLLDVAVDDQKTIHVLSGDGGGGFSVKYPTLSIVPPAATILIAAPDENGDTYADLLLYTVGAQDGNTRYPITLYDYITSGTATATLPAATYATGSHPLTASTNGTVDILAGTAATTLVVDAPAASTVTLTASPTTPANYGTALVKLTATIPVSSATGTISFYNGTALLGTSPLVDQTNSTAILTTAILPAGTYSFKAVYAGDGSHGSGTSTFVPYVIQPIAATLSWTPNPATIAYGTPLSSAQLNAAATGITGAAVAGAFTYAPALGTVLAAGTNPVVATFTPTDTNYASSTITRNIAVTQATPTITWLPNPSRITYGTALSTAQLDATASTAGTFVYNPALGTVLTVGTQTLNVTFTPTDATDFTTASKAATIAVLPAGLTVSPTTLTFGNQPYGTTSAAQTVTVTNPGADAISISGVSSTVEPNPEDFLPTTTCPASLPPGATCQISVAFKPDGVGPKSGVIDITTNVPYHGISVSGAGTGGILQVNPGNLKTIAGNGTQGDTGDKGLATAAELNNPDGVAFDSLGNLYIADTFNNVVRKVETSGKISTVAGNGTDGYMGDGAAATSAELSLPFSVTLDKAGNLYIQDTGNALIRKVDTSGIITTFAGTADTTGHAGDGGPATMATFLENQGARFDAAGNLFVPQCRQPSIRKIDTKGIVTTVAGNFTTGYTGDGGLATSAQLSCPSGVAFDAAGNFYIADYYNYAIRKVDTKGIITTIAGNGTPGATGDGGPATAATLNLPNDVMLDAEGNLFIADSANNSIRKIDTKGIITTVAGGLGSAGSAVVNTPEAVTLDSSGNLYFSDSNNNAVRELFPQGTTPFPATVIGTAATPQTLTLSNVGNVPIVIPSSASFTLTGNAADFSLSGGTCLKGATLATNESTCTLQISFTPVAVGTRTLTVSIADDALNTPQSFTIGGLGTSAAPTLTWPPPASIVYGTPLSATQLDAVATGLAGAAVAGTFTYTPAAGAVLTAGPHALSVLFTSADPNYTNLTASVPITVAQAIPNITWTPDPASIVYGTPLSASQLDAASTVAGTFTYTPALGTVLAAGTQTLSAVFTPTDAVDYKSVTTTTTITVTRLTTPAITWIPNPATIPYGTPLSAAQLDATSSTPGTFTYTPALGTVLAAGMHTLSVLFTPTDAAHFKSITTTASITVTQAKPVLKWSTPAMIAYGTALSATQLDATATGISGIALPGIFTYTPAAGTILPVGNTPLSVLFTPTDAVDYTTASASVIQCVTLPATTTVLVSSLSKTEFGQPVTFTATTTSTKAVTGTVTFYDGSTLLGTSSAIPASITLSTLTAGSHTISAVFAANSNFAGSKSAGLTIIVAQAAPAITWLPNPYRIAYGTALSTAQLDAKASTAGTFTYTPALGTILTTGLQTLSATFNPADPKDFKSVTATATISVTAIAPAITWEPNPATIAYGTALSAAQLDATSSTPGTFTYTPPSGTVLSAGTQSLSVTFHPKDWVDFIPVTTMTTIVVTPVTPIITWKPDPATISFGTALTTAQLDATTTTPGTFTYTPALGTRLTAGTHTVFLIFSPADATDFNSVTRKQTIVVTPVTPVVMWKPNPTTIPYGTALTAAQLDATSATPGTFLYVPALGTRLPIGTHTISATFMPTDATNYTSVTRTATIVVIEGTPAITWVPKPATINFGTALSVAQLDATSAVPGTFAYTPALGTVLSAGTQTLSALFTPSSTTGYSPLTVTTTITVTTATPAITWSPDPATITFGTALSAAELDATSTTPGTFAYTPAIGTVLTVGTHTLSSTFTPANSTDFKAVTTTTTLVVTTATPVVTWKPSPTTFSYGTALMAAQLDATSTTPGTFTYAPALGTLLTAGTHSISATFTPADDRDFKSVTKTATITVTQATPAITWFNPASIPVGTPLSGTQLDAAATGVTGHLLPGTFTYTPAAGTVLSAGTQTLKVSFTATDLTNYTTAVASVSIQIVPFTLTALSATNAALGDPAKTITLTGTGFVPTAVVQVGSVQVGSAQVGSVAIPTTFVNTTTLTATIPASYFLASQILQISVAESSQSQATNPITFLVGAPLAAAVFTGPSTTSPGTDADLTFKLTNPYPVDLTATFTVSFTPAAGLPDDPTVLFASGGTTYIVVIPANSTASPIIAVQSATVAGTMTVDVILQAGGVNVTPPSIQPVVIQAPLAVPGVNSATLTRSGNTLTVTVRGFSNPRDMTQAKFHFTPIPGGTIGTEDVTIDVVPIFTTWYADPDSTQYGSTFTYKQIFNLSSDASVVGQVSVTLANSVGVSPEANTP